MCVKSRKRGGVRGESVSVSHSRFCWLEVGLVFRLSDGTLVCPEADLVLSCCSSAENDRGREEREEYQKQKKKLWVQGL